MKYSESWIRSFRAISIISGLFTFVVAFIMIMSLIQLKTINPLVNPALEAVRQQFENNPDSKELADQMRAMDFMARKAYFTARWQIETGSYLLLAGAVFFVFFQWLVSSAEPMIKGKLPPKPVPAEEKQRYRKYLIVSASAMALLAIISSFILRPVLIDTWQSGTADSAKMVKGIEIPQPDGINYPFFRGEGGRGIAGGEGYPTEWDGNSGKNIRWKVPVPKHGRSSPVIWGNKIFLTGSEGDETEVYCIDKISGEILWSAMASDFQGASKEIPETDPEVNLSASTPAVNSSVVCAIFGNGNLVAYNHEGKPKWATNLGVPEHIYGYSSSLLIFNDILIVQYDSEKRLSLIGFDLNTGKIKWETMRRGRPVNSSPVLAVFNGVTQVIVNGSPELTAFDPLTGKELWSIKGVVNDVAVSPAINSNLVYVSANYESLLAIRPGPNPLVAWSDNSYTPDVPSSVATDEFLFTADATGAIACYKADSKEILWEHYFNEPFYASPVLAGGLVYFLDRKGVMHVVKASNTLEIVSESVLGENSDCTPAFSEKRIYIRGENNLYCISND